MRPGVVVFITAAVAALAGCDPQPKCDPAGYAGLLGQPEAALEGITVDLRIIRPDSAVTADYDPARLNAEIDAQGRIAKFACY